MAKGGYYSPDGIARKITKAYYSPNGIARRVKKAYIGVNGIARLFWSSGLKRINTASLRNGARGIGAASLKNYAVFAGGATTGSTYYKNVDAFDSAGVRIDTVNDLVRARYEIAGVTDDCYDYNICFVGGYDVVGTSHTGTVVDIYDDELVNVYNGAMFEAGLGRYGAAGCAVYGHFYIGGGMNKNTSEYFKDVYDCYENYRGEWGLHGENELESKSFRCAAANTDVYGVFAGGLVSSSTPHKKVTAFDAMITAEPAVEELGTAKYYHAGARVENNVIFAGGRGANNVYKDADAFDRLVTKIDGIEDLSVARYQLEGVSYEGYAMFIGGINGSTAYDTIDVYDENLTLVEETGIAMSKTRYDVAAATAGDKLYVAGGQVASNAVTSDVDIFTY